MKIQVTDNQIYKIAEDLDCGLKCYYNFRTKEIIRVIDQSDSWDLTDEDEVKLAEIMDNWDDYFEFEKMDSRTSFLVMEEFIGEVSNEGFRNRLINALNRPKPFRNFKIEIDNSGEYRQSWFDFKNQKMIDWVKNQIEDYNSHNLM